MSDEIFALMEAAEATQKAAQTLVEKADKQTRQAQAAIDRLEALPGAVTRRVAEEAARAMREAATEAAASLDGRVKRLQTVGAWWPLIFAVLVLSLCGVLLYAYETKTLKDLKTARAELKERRAELARTPKVVRYTDSAGRQFFGVEVEARARPMEMSDGKTLEDVCADPVKTGIKWDDITALFIACGGVLEEARGSRVCVEINGVVAHFHRPHPQPDTDKGAVKSVRRFLENAGVIP